MYIETYGTLFNSKLEDTEKLAHRMLSVSEKNQDGSYTNDSWPIRLSGKAKDALKDLPEKTRVKVYGSVYTGYNKEKKQSFPYIFVGKIEKVEKKAADEPVPTADEAIDW